MRGVKAAGVFLAVACLPLAARARDDENEDDALGEAILETRVTLALDRATVRQVVEAIAQKTGMQYMAVDDALDMERTVTLHITMRSVDEVLEFLEGRLDLNLDWGHLEETGVLIVGPAEADEGEDEGEEEQFDPQLGHAEALEMIRSHPAVARLVEKRPDLAIDLEWDADERRWEADLRLGDDEIGRVELREFDEAKPRIIDIEIDHDAVGPVGRARDERDGNF